MGAGASIGANRFPKDSYSLDKKMPSGKNFFYDVFEIQKPSKGGLDFFNILGMTYEGLNLLIQQAWKLNPDRQAWDKKQWENINIEDVFTFIDVGTKIYRKNSNYGKFFEHARKSLIKFIFIIISMRTLGQRCLYLEKLFGKLNDEDSIISFNWDTLADTTFEYLSNSQYQNYLSLFTNRSIDIRKYKKKGLLLKLHGSVNWMTCSNRKCKSYNLIQLITSTKYSDLKRLSLSDFDGCKHCGNKLEVYIIPPTSNKIDIYKNSFIHKQWLLVREKLRHISKLVFIGYSFPLTDFYAEWLFRQINFLIDTEKKFVQVNIDIVNPEVMNKKSTTYKRYKYIFKGHRFNFYENLKSYVAKDYVKPANTDG